MSGNRAVLDTNCIIYLLKYGNPIEQILEDYDWIGISIISKIEFLAYPNLSNKDLNLFNLFLSRVDIIEISEIPDSGLLNQIITLRRLYKLKLPDIIIAATAIYNQAELITADKAIQSISELKLRILP